LFGLKHCKISLEDSKYNQLIDLQADLAVLQAKQAEEAAAKAEAAAIAEAARLAQEEADK
jgi:hypothetical protein